MIYDVIILGAGPAGLTAAIYAQRANLNCLVMEKEYASGGQVVNTYEVDNYPGTDGRFFRKYRSKAYRSGR